MFGGFWNVGRYSFEVKDKRKAPTNVKVNTPVDYVLYEAKALMLATTA